MDDLIKRLRSFASTDDGASPYVADGKLCDEAAARIGLYREALRRARRIIATETLLPDELAAIDAVLSRA